MTLHVTIAPLDSADRTLTIHVRRAYNFGYAGRRQEDVKEHVEELRELGLPAPTRTPSIYPIGSELIVAAERVDVRGDQTYGEAEVALIHGGDGWYVGVASDHSDFAVEQVSTPRAKTVYPDVVSPVLWALDDVRPHWDRLELRGERLDDSGWSLIQQATMDALLTPDELIRELGARTGEAATEGTALLSGTIAGEILPGASGWRNTLVDPVLGRELRLEYIVHEHALEL